MQSEAIFTPFPAHTDRAMRTIALLLATLAGAQTKEEAVDVTGRILEVLK
jgi:hypothetical protein